MTSAARKEVQDPVLSPSKKTGKYDIIIDFFSIRRSRCPKNTI
jgi:hypothetical protein